MNAKAMSPRQEWCLLLGYGALLFSSVLQASPPSVPANVRVIFLPAEVLLSWDGSPDAAYYGVYRAELDRRWMPIADRVTVSRFRDTEFRSLPCYYQIKAVNAAGEIAVTPEFLCRTVSSRYSRR